MFSTLQLTQTVALSIAVVKGSNLAQCHSHSQFNITTVCCHHSDMKPDREQASRSKQASRFKELKWMDLNSPGRTMVLRQACLDHFPQSQLWKGLMWLKLKVCFQQIYFFFLFFFKIGKTQTKVEWKQKQQLGTCSPYSLHFQTEGWLFFKLFFFFFQPRSFKKFLYFSRNAMDLQEMSLYITLGPGQGVVPSSFSPTSPSSQTAASFFLPPSPP